VILAGDQRLNDKLRREELIPLGSRIRIRFNIDYANTSQLMHCLEHLLASAGNPHLMTRELMQTLCDHAMGNYRVLCTMANELLTTAALQEKSQLDEKLYLECFAIKTSPRKPKNTAGGARG
jgi:general secretion pathway protein A